MQRIARTSACAVVALLVLALPGRAQNLGDWDASRFHMTREALQQLLTMYEDASRSKAFSDELRARARYEADLVRTRLNEGDFQVGDRIALTVEGQQALSDTFLVSMGRVLTLPVIGDIPLSGVLRSELESHLTSAIGRFIKNPVVHARSMIRVSVLGAVGQPGFYVVPSEAILTDVLMRAGGPGATAKLTDIRIERGSNSIWEGDPLQQAIIEGRTLDQLSLRAGDRVVVPEKGQRSWFTIVQVVGALSTVIFAATRVF